MGGGGFGVCVCVCLWGGEVFIVDRTGLIVPWQRAQDLRSAVAARAEGACTAAVAGGLALRSPSARPSPPSGTGTAFPLTGTTHCAFVFAVHPVCADERPSPLAPAPRTRKTTLKTTTPCARLVSLRTSGHPRMLLCFRTLGPMYMHITNLVLGQVTAQDLARVAGLIEHPCLCLAPSVCLLIHAVG